MENIRPATVTNRARGWSLVHQLRWIIAMNHPDTTFPIVMETKSRNRAQ